jgi:hypothetical protein
VGSMDGEDGGKVTYQMWQCPNTPAGQC